MDPGNTRVAAALAAPRKRRTINVYSRPGALTNLDGRSIEARIMKTVRADLKARIGGNPNAAQAMLIEQAAQLTLRIAMMDAKTAEGRELTPHDSRTYLAWVNSLSKVLRHLGLEAKAQRQPTLAEHKASRAAAA